MQDKIIFSFVQQAMSNNKQINLENSIDKIKEAKKLGADIAILPELHNYLYFCQTESLEKFDLAEELGGYTCQLLSQAAKKEKIIIVGSFFEKRIPGIYHNTAVVYETDGSLAGIYRKMHIPDDPGYYEKYYFTPGDIGFRPINTSIGKLGVLICWDQWFPEAARCMALNGAECLIYPTAIGFDPKESAKQNAMQLNAWQLVQRGHAIANGLPVISCNRYGFEKDDNYIIPSKPDALGEAPSQLSEYGQIFWGNSFIAGPQGEILSQAESDKDFIGIAEISKKQCEQIRRAWPFLRDRRIDAYSDLSSICSDNISPGR